MELTLLALAFGAGVDLRRVALLGLALTAPAIVGVVITAAIWHLRRQPDTLSALFCEGVASELRSGSSLDGALREAASSVGVGEELSDAVGPADVAVRLQSRFEDIGPELASTIRAASRAGSQSADLFDQIGAVAIAQAEIRREVRVASAPARVTALLFVFAPTLYVLQQLRSGGAGDLLADSHQRLAWAAGLLLFCLGLVAAGLMMWRAR